MLLHPLNHFFRRRSPLEKQKAFTRLSFPKLLPGRAFAPYVRDGHHFVAFMIFGAAWKGREGEGGDSAGEASHRLRQEVREIGERVGAADEDGDEEDEGRLCSFGANSAKT